MGRKRVNPSLIRVLDRTADLAVRARALTGATGLVSKHFNSRREYKWAQARELSVGKPDKMLGGQCRSKGRGRGARVPPVFSGNLRRWASDTPATKTEMCRLYCVQLNILCLYKTFVENTMAVFTVKNTFH